MQLTEEFKTRYESFINNRIMDECYIVSTQINLEEAMIVRALDVTNTISMLMESAKLNEADESSIDAILKQVQSISSTLTGSRPVTSKDLATDLTKNVYEPIFVEKRTDISDLRNPIEKIKFLLGRIVDWLKRVVLYAFNKCKAILYTIVGRKDDASKMLEKTSTADLKFRLKKLEKLETGFIKPVKAGSTAKPVQIVEVRPDVINQNTAIFRPLTESVSVINEKTWDEFNAMSDDERKAEYEKMINKTDNKDENNINKNNRNNAIDSKRNVLRTVELNVSQDLYALQQTLHHFFELFDSAFGSQGENLFDTSDLILVFKYIENITKGFEKGNMNPALIQAQMSNISSEVVYDNLIRTKANVDNLNKAYYDTYTAIDKINKIMTNKQLLSLSTYGVNYMFLSQHTYSAMADLLTYIDARLKEATKMQKELDDAKKKYEELVNRIDKLRNSIKGFGYVSVNTIYERKINDLFASTKYMTQITSLRLNCLMKYIQELQSVRLTIANLNNLSAAQRNSMQINVSRIM